MNRQSIFFTISVSFIISLILVVISFLIIMVGNQKKLEHHLFEKYQPLTKMLFRKKSRYNDFNFKKNLENFNYDLFLNKSDIDSITYNPQTSVIAQRRFRDSINRVLQLNDRQFFYMNRKGKT